MMDNSSNSTNRQEDTPEADGRISMDAYVLLAVLATIIMTVIVQMVSHVQNNKLLDTVTGSLLIISSFYCIATAWWRSSTAQHSIQKRSVSMSTAFGSLLSGLFSVVFADFDSNMILPVVIAFCFVIAALCVIGIIFLQFEDAKKVQPSKKVRQTSRHTKTQQTEIDDYRNDPLRRVQESGPTPIDLQPQRPPEFASQVNRPPAQPQVQAMYPSANSFPPDDPLSSSPPPVHIATSISPGQLNIMPSQESTLRSLFEGDELYDIPRNTQAQLFINTKSNDLPENCEDACAISDEKHRFALCDGVSTSRFSRPWAKSLAERWVAQPLQEDDAEAVDKWLEEPRNRWRIWVSTIWLEKINRRNRSMGRIEFTPADMKKFIAQGAAATFLGLTLNDATSTWTAFSVGDTCLIHFFRNKSDTWEYESFPYESSAQFTDEPFSITSRTNTASIVASNILRLNNQPYKAGDILIMVTDALAEWLLRHLESKEIDNIITLLEGMNGERFTKFVGQQRASKELKDDDTTLIIVRL